MKILYAAVLIAVVVSGFLLGWLPHLFGLDNLSGPFYGFWSGVGSGSPVLGGIALYWHHHNCHIPGCWRLQWKASPSSTGTDHIICRKHHPAPTLTHQQVIDDYHNATNGGASG